ncbi:MAG: hypothetical protein JWP80_4628 [Pseudomonas sp.]|nr:hypothetical protein [Pseudomonas sp.]
MYVKKMTAQLGLTGFMALAAAFSMPAAHAFGLADIAPAAGATKGSSVDVGSLLSQQKDLMGRFKQSMNNMLVAQALTLEAGGLKEDAQKASAAAANYGQGSVITKDQLDRDTKVSENASKVINEQIKKNVTLSAAGQEKLLSAVPHYGAGMYEGTKLPKSFQSWTDSAKGGLSSLKTDPMNASKLTGSLDDVTTVATNLPALLGTWTTTSKAFLNYAKSNKVDTKDLSSKMGSL